MRIGITYDLKAEVPPGTDLPDDFQEEFDSPVTVEAIAAVLRGLVSQLEDMLTARAEEAPQDELAELTGIRTGPSESPDDPVLSRLLPDFHKLDPDNPTREDLDSAAAMRSALEAFLRTIEATGGCVRPGGMCGPTGEEIFGLEDGRLVLSDRPGLGIG